MVKSKYYSTRKDGVDLCEIFSTIQHKLRQQETENIYGCSVVDVVEGYSEDGEPYSRYTYVETEEVDLDYPEEEEE